MIVDSKTMYGFRLREPGKPLLLQGRNELEFRALTRGEQELIRALVVAKVVTIIEEDAPAVVIPFPAPHMPSIDPIAATEPPPVAAKPMKRRVRRVVG